MLVDPGESIVHDRTWVAFALKHHSHGREVEPRADTSVGKYKPLPGIHHVTEFLTEKGSVGVGTLVRPPVPLLHRVAPVSTVLETVGLGHLNGRSV